MDAFVRDAYASPAVVRFLTGVEGRVSKSDLVKIIFSEPLRNENRPPQSSKIVTQSHAADRPLLYLGSEQATDSKLGLVLHPKSTKRGGGTPRVGSRTAPLPVIIKICVF